MLTGKPLPRREDIRLLQGLGQYVDDIHLDGMLHAAVFRSAWAHARVNTIDVSEANALPGVVAVYTGQDLADVLSPIRPRIAALPHFEDFLQCPLAIDTIRYVGEPLAIVIAESPYIAEDALNLIDIDVEELQPVLNWDQAAANSTLIHPTAGTNISTVEVGRGDCETAFASAAYTRLERFSIQRHTAMPMETRGLVAQWDEAKQVMTVSGATKIPFFNRGLLASMLALPLEAIVMKVGDVGGSYGVRGEFYPEDFLVPFAARKLNRPVKWVEDRREHFMATNHSREMYCDLEIACSAEGIITGLRGRVTFDIGAYARGTGGTPPTRAAQFLPGPYRIPNFECSVNAYVSNKTPSGTYRGPGRFEANFFRERLIDIAAREMNIDPAEMREMNLISASEMPFNMDKLVSYEEPESYDSGDFVAVFEKTLSDIGWDEKKHIQGTQIDGWYHGIGFAPFVESSAGGPREFARIRLAENGIVELYSGSASSGQGHETVFAQVLSDALDVEYDQIKVICSSTDQLVDSMGTYHSRSAVMAGNATLVTARKFKLELEGLAREYFNLPNADLEWRNGSFANTDTQAVVSLDALAEFAQKLERSVDVTDVFTYDGMKPFSYGCHAAHVAVDPRTGRVRIVDFIAYEDIGRVLNPLIVHGQSLGAIVQGLGGVFMEELHYNDDGQLLTASFADYLVPTATDFPCIRSKFVEVGIAPGNELGAKGGGEGGIVAAAAAVGNAVSAALSSLNVQVTDLPLSPPKVWKMIQSAQA